MEESFCCRNVIGEKNKSRNLPRRCSGWSFPASTSASSPPVAAAATSTVAAAVVVAVVAAAEGVRLRQLTWRPPCWGWRCSLRPPQPTPLPGSRSPGRWRGWCRAGSSARFLPSGVRASISGWNLKKVGSNRKSIQIKHLRQKWITFEATDFKFGLTLVKEIQSNLT